VGLYQGLLIRECDKGQEGSFVPTVLLGQFEVKVDKLEEATTQLQYTDGRQFEL
jgi:hypothetical protein